MNEVRLQGHFCRVTAYTDGTVQIDDDYSWIHEDGFYHATFLVVDGAWIEVYVRETYFEYWREHYVDTLDTLLIEGRLSTDVGRGSGIVSNYVVIG